MAEGEQMSRGKPLLDMESEVDAVGEAPAKFIDSEGKRDIILWLDKF